MSETADMAAKEWKDKGLVSAVPPEVYLAYEDRARSIAEQYAPNAAPAAKVAILKFAIEARLSGAEVRKRPLLKDDGLRWPHADPDDYE